jgi:hypothetical protein
LENDDIPRRLARCDEITAPFMLDGPINGESFLAAWRSGGARRGAEQ